MDVTASAAPQIVRRDEIVAALRVVSGARLAPLAAPAGYGKSTALQQFARAMPRALATYEVAYDVGTFARFLRGICDTLAPYATGPRLTFAGAFDRARHAPDMHTRLAQWLHSHLEGLELTLAVDAMHHAQPFIRHAIDFFDAFAEHADPGGVRLLLTARSLDDFPIPRWMASGYMVMPVEARRFALTPDETAALAEGFGLATRDRDIERLREATDGCALGVIFALWRAQRTRSGIEAAEPASLRDIDASVFHLLSARERELVERTMLAGTLDRGMLAALDVDAGEFEAFRAAAPLAFDPIHEVAAYRSDFARYARNRLREHDPSAFDVLLARTVEALLENGHASRALELALRAGRRDAALAVLEAHAHELLDDAEIVEETLHRFGDAERPALMMLHGVIDARHGRLDTAEAWLREAMNRADHPRTRRDAAEALATELMRAGRPDAVDILEAMLRDEPDEPLMALSMLAQALVIAERHDDARRTLDAALALPPPQSAEEVAKVGSRLAFASLRVGNTVAAQQWAERTAQAGKAARLYTYVSGAFSILYELAGARDSIGEAISYLHELADAAMKSGNVEYHLYALVGLLDLATERADFDALERYDRALRSFDVRYTAQNTNEGLLPGLALRAAWSGAFGYACELLGSSAERQMSVERAALRWAEIALYAAAAGQRTRAAKAINAAHVLHALDQVGEQTVAFKAAVLAALAAAKTDADSSRAAALLDAAGPAPDARLASLASGVHALIRRVPGAQIVAVLEDLWAHDLGGYALLFAALPAHGSGVA